MAFDMLMPFTVLIWMSLATAAIMTAASSPSLALRPRDPGRRGCADLRTASNTRLLVMQPVGITNCCSTSLMHSAAVFFTPSALAVWNNSCAFWKARRNWSVVYLFSFARCHISSPVRRDLVVGLGLLGSWQSG